MAAKSAQDHANDATLYSLLATAKDAWIRAANPPTRGRGSSSRGRGRGISGLTTSGGNASPLSLSGITNSCIGEIIFDSLF